MRGAVADAGQCAGVAVREHSRTVVDQGCSMSTEAAVGLYVLVGDADGLGDRIGRRAGPLDSPRQVGGGGPGRDDRCRGVVDRFAVHARQRDAHRSGGTECRRPADGQRADQVTELGHRVHVEHHQLVGQATLVDQLD